MGINATERRVSERRTLKAGLASTLRYGDLGRSLAKLCELAVVPVEGHIFPDGERYSRITEGCRGRDIWLLGGTVSDAETLELYDLACGFVQEGVRSLSLIVPYFGYSTMERALHSGEVVVAKNRARLLSSVPPASMGNRIYLLDLHSEGITHYFEGGLAPFHVSGHDLVADIVRELGYTDYVVACTDAGRAKWVERLASTLEVSAGFAYKKRIDGRRSEIVDVSAHVSGKSVVIYDDMIRTGGSLINAAEAYLEAGATQISAITTHGIFPADSFRRLLDSGLFDKVCSTDSHPRAMELRDEGLQVYSIASLLAQEVVLE